MTTDSWGRSSWSWLLKPTGRCPPTLLPLSSGCLWTGTDCGQRQRRQRQEWMSHCWCRTHTNNVHRKNTSQVMHIQRTLSMILNVLTSRKLKSTLCKLFRPDICGSVFCKSFGACLYQLYTPRDWNVCPFFFAKQIKLSQTDFFEWI